MDLIGAYSDDDSSDEDTVASVSVLTKREIDTEDDRSKKRSKVDDLPDLPEDIFGDEEEESKVDARGRRRQFGHVQGNYPTFVYIDSKEDIRTLIDDTKRMGRDIGIDQDVDHYHVSLSRVFPIREHHIDALEKQLVAELSSMQSFDITLDHSTLTTFVNDDGTRIFLSAPVANGRDRLIACIRAVDRVLSRFNFPVFHEDAKPHLSISIRSQRPANNNYTAHLHFYNTVESWAVRSLLSIDSLMGDRAHTFKKLNFTPPTNHTHVHHDHSDSSYQLTQRGFTEEVHLKILIGQSGSRVPIGHQRDN
eukprot:gene6622-7697_t